MIALWFDSVALVGAGPRLLGLHEFKHNYVFFDPPPPAGVGVNLQSSNSAVALPQSSVTVPAQAPQNSAQFSVSTYNVTMDLSGLYVLGSLNRHITVHSQQCRAINLIAP